MDTCLSWTSESTSPIPPCLHGSWAYGCLVYKPSPIFERIHSSIQVRETERERGSTYRVLFMTKSRELQQQTQRRNIDCAHVYISRTNKLWNNIHFLLSVTVISQFRYFINPSSIMLTEQLKTFLFYLQNLV